jgi:hypothetical protein
MMLTNLLRDARTISVPSTGSVQIAGVNPRRRRLTISPPLGNPVQVELNGPASATAGYPLVVGGPPLILDANLFGAAFYESVQAIAIVGSATVYVIDEFDPPEWMP